MTNLSGHSVRSELLALCLIEALICFAAFYLILSAGMPAGSLGEQSLLLMIAGSLAICSGLVSGAAGLYHPPTWLRAGRLMAGTALATLLVLLVTQFAFPRLLHVVSLGWTGQAALVVAFVAAVVGTRMIFTGLARGGLLRREVLLLSEPGAHRVRAVLRGDPFFQVAGEVKAEQMMAALDQPGGFHPRAVIADAPEALPAALRRTLAEKRVRVWRTSDFIEGRLGRVDLDGLSEGWVRAARGSRSGQAEAVVRRSLDLLLSVALLTVAMPVILVTALAIKLDSPGPVFYRQQRVGQHGRIFTLFKFRSMTAKAEAAGQAIWAQKDDPRVTRVGKFIRLTRIDEIPQVFNVLRGDMAFIGPRPERPEFVARLAQKIPHYNDRAVLRPGITGWAQVNYPYGASEEDARMKLTYDLYYVRRRSLFLDLIILVATVRVVLFQEGSR